MTCGTIDAPAFHPFVIDGRRGQDPRGGLTGDQAAHATHEMTMSPNRSALASKWLAQCQARQLAQAAP
jgi:hypothetical protein